jgi:hypothetical protein
LRLGFCDEIEVVYPDWKGTGEWEFGKEYRYIQPYQSRIRVMVFSDWLAGSNPGKVVFGNAARSSSWTPPWLDSEFGHLIGRLPFESKICLDCRDGVLQTEGYNACKPRRWDAEEVRSRIRSIKEKL